jgi:hypothetical protein
LAEGPLGRFFKGMFGHRVAAYGNHAPSM